ncbi:hypothetical protein FQA39_LY18656 [Lamprigera yunnana]|nr:hypothetical protein FQA39_LY18656 [Lamprigera yunnana]
MREGESCLQQCDQLQLLQPFHGFAARVAGDKFALVLRQCSRDKADALAAQLCETLQNWQPELHGRHFVVTISIGLLRLGPQFVDAQQIIRIADMACYDAKRRGGNSPAGASSAFWQRLPSVDGRAAPCPAPIRTHWWPLAHRILRDNGAPMNTTRPRPPPLAGPACALQLIGITKRYPPWWPTASCFSGAGGRDPCGAGRKRRGQIHADEDHLRRRQAGRRPDPGGRPARTHPQPARGAPAGHQHGVPAFQPFRHPEPWPKTCGWASAKPCRWPSFGYQEFVQKAAADLKDVKFEHATGYKQSANVAVYDSKTFEGAYLAGIVAGAMSKTKTVGVVASVPIPEVVRNLNSFVLGAQSVDPSIKAKVVWVNEWFAPPKESEAATSLINGGVDVLYQNTNSPAVLKTAEERGAYAFGKGRRHERLRPQGPPGLGRHQLEPLLHQGGREETTCSGNWQGGNYWWGVKEGAMDLVKIADQVPQAHQDKVKKNQGRHETTAALP